jgi:hypothetical protein
MRYLPTTVVVFLVLSITLSVPVAAQQDLAQLTEGLFPGEVWFEVSGAWSNSGVGSAQSSILGRRGEPQSQSVVASRYETSDWPASRIFLELSVYSPETPDQLEWIEFHLSGLNLLNLAPATYAVVDGIPVNKYPDSPTPFVTASVADNVKDLLYDVIEGNAFFEVSPIEDVIATRFAVDVTFSQHRFEETEGQPVRIRAAGYLFDLPGDWDAIFELPAGEAALNLVGELAATDADSVTVRVEPDTGEDASETFTFDVATTGYHREQPDRLVPIQFSATTQAAPIQCDPEDYHSAPSSAVGFEDFRVDESAFTFGVRDPQQEPEAYVRLCYDDAEGTRVSGRLWMLPSMADWEDWFRYQKLDLAFHGIPVERDPA